MPGEIHSEYSVQDLFDQIPLFRGLPKSLMADALGLFSGSGNLSNTGNFCLITGVLTHDSDGNTHCECLSRPQSFILSQIH